MAENGETQPMLYVRCPSCGSSIGEEAYDALAGDLINGAVIDCPGCNHELELDIYVSVTDRDYEEE